MHGGGGRSRRRWRAGLDVSFVGGRRVTDERAIQVVREALLDVNRELCAARSGPRAVGLAGDEIGLRATPRPGARPRRRRPCPVAPQAILEALAADRIPVVAPLAEGPLNVNADDAAAALAIGLGADRILFLTDVPGRPPRRPGARPDRRRRGRGRASSRAGSCRSCRRPCGRASRASRPRSARRWCSPDARDPHRR